MNTDESRSKVSTPSGRGYSIRCAPAASISVSLSGYGCLNVQGALPRNKYVSIAEYASPPHSPNLANEGRILRTKDNSCHTQLSRSFVSYDVRSGKLPASAAATISAANIPDFIDVCVPLIFGTFTNP